MSFDFGYVMVARSILNSRSASRGLDYLALMVIFIIKANRENGYFCGVRINRGEFAFSTLKLAESINIDRSKLNRMMKNLEKDNFIVKKANRQFTVVTICNYDFYQTALNYSRSTVDQEQISQQTNNNLKEHKKRTSTNHKQEVKKQKKYSYSEEIYTKFGEEVGEGFEVWEAYRIEKDGDYPPAIFQADMLTIARIKEEYRAASLIDSAAAKARKIQNAENFITRNGKLTVPEEIKERINFNEDISTEEMEALNHV